MNTRTDTQLAEEYHSDLSHLGGVLHTGCAYVRMSSRPPEYRLIVVLAKPILFRSGTAIDSFFPAFGFRKVLGLERA